MLGCLVCFTVWVTRLWFSITSPPLSTNFWSKFISKAIAFFFSKTGGRLSYWMPRRRPLQRRPGRLLPTEARGADLPQLRHPLHHSFDNVLNLVRDVIQVEHDSRVALSQCGYTRTSAPGIQVDSQVLDVIGRIADMHWELRICENWSVFVWTQKWDFGR